MGRKRKDTRTVWISDSEGHEPLLVYYSSIKQNSSHEDYRKLTGRTKIHSYTVIAAMDHPCKEYFIKKNNRINWASCDKVEDFKKQLDVKEFDSKVERLLND